MTCSDGGGPALQIERKGIFRLSVNEQEATLPSVASTTEPKWGFILRQHNLDSNKYCA